MWTAASDDVKTTYGRQYLDNLVAGQRRAVKGGATSTAPVVDAMVDAIVSGRPETRYMIDGGFFDIHTVGQPLPNSSSLSSCLCRLIVLIITTLITFIPNS